MRRVLFAVALTVVAISLLTAPSGATTKPGPQVVSAPGDYSLLRNSNSFKCLVAQNGANNAPVFQYQCDTQLADQLWHLKWAGTDESGNYYWLKNKVGEKCLVVQGPDNGSPAFQYDCLSFRDQYWRLVPVQPGDPRYTLENVSSGKCLVVQGDDNGNRAFLYSCFPYADQRWYFDGL